MGAMQLSFEQLDAMETLGSRFGVDPLYGIEIVVTKALPDGYVGFKVKGEYFTCSPTGKLIQN